MRSVVFAFMCMTVCMGVGLLALPLFLPRLRTDSTIAKSRKVAELKTDKKIVPRANFPDELAPVVEGKAVVKAAQWKNNQNPVMVVLERWSGKLHRWHDGYLKEEWRGYSVEKTELALIVSKQTKHYAPSKVPAEKQYGFQLIVWLVEAKTGKIVASGRQFSKPTRQGHAVRWTQVGQWLESIIASSSAENAQTDNDGTLPSNSHPEN